MDERELAFARRAVRRKRTFLALSWIGILAAALLGSYYLYHYLSRGESSGLTLRLVVVTLILLNARQNLRQYRYARLLERVLPPR